MLRFPYSSILAMLMLFTMLAGCSHAGESTFGHEAQPPQPTPQDGASRPDITARPQQLGRIQPSPSQPRPEELGGEQHQDGRERRDAGMPVANKADGQSRSLPRRNDIKGIYVSGWTAGSGKRLAALTRLVERTELNAMVIDVKNEFGQLTYRSELDAVHAVRADASPLIGDMPGLLERLKMKDIYSIGRVVVFRDPLLAKRRPELAIRRRDGAVWLDNKGLSWVDPHQRAVWDYNIAIAREAAQLGFDEIQFDYVRFPDNGKRMDAVVRYAARGGETKAQAVAAFLRQARPAVHEAGAAVSADVFGLVTTSRDDMDIGQTWRAIASEVDVISPMTYPSHYSPGMYGIRHPDLSPAEVVGHAFADAERRNAILRGEGIEPGEIRPWLQAFTATWLHPHQTYGSRQIKQQIEAARQRGIGQYLLWNASNRYPELS